ncbi:MAG: aminoglycoside adenylyltransferase family protein [Actinomycetota bacterium]|nr:aminoglycoside adenylyltransferase family protein [Actinomycetota bacterium]
MTASAITPGTGHEAQLRKVVEHLQHTLGEKLVGAYLFGSAVLGGLKPSSDLDVMAVSTRPTNLQEKRGLVSGLMNLSGKPLHLEVTIVVHSEVRPWSYPPKMDFQYGDWWRDEYEQGNVEPWPSPTNPDLSSLIRMVLLADTPLLGPSASDVFDEIPSDDYVRSLRDGVDDLVGDIEGDTRNVVLTLARMWASLVTDEVFSKDAAAQWALDRLPRDKASVLSEARSMYLGERDNWSHDPLADARAYAEHVIREIEAASRHS